MMARRTFAGGRLAEDAGRLRALDEASPPEAKPCLMEVVRTLADYIQTRSKLGWTDTMIADLLTEAGYPISAGTLRSYRKRLRDEAGDPAAKTVQPAVKIVQVDQPSQPRPATTSPERKGAPAAKLAQPSSRGDTFKVNNKNLPSERA